MTVRRRGTNIASDRRAVTIVEFGIIAIPFFLLLAAVFEQAIIFYKHELLQTAVSASGRLVLTGQAASANGYTQEQFRQQICSRLPAFIQCGTISVDVRPYTSFTSARAFKPVDVNGNFDPTQLGYNSGASGSIIVVSAYSVQPIMFPNLNRFYSNNGTGKILISSQAVFRNEPYS